MESDSIFAHFCSLEYHKSKSGTWRLSWARSLQLCPEKWGTKLRHWDLKTLLRRPSFRFAMRFSSNLWRCSFCCSQPNEHLWFLVLLTHLVPNSHLLSHWSWSISLEQRLLLSSRFRNWYSETLLKSCSHWTMNFPKFQFYFWIHELQRRVRVNQSFFLKMTAHLHHRRIMVAKVLVVLISKVANFTLVSFSSDWD